jgi:hypothetical protein
MGSLVIAMLPFVAIVVAAGALARGLDDGSRSIDVDSD